MEQVAWTAIGLLAVALFGMFGAFFYLGNKIDGMNSSLNGRMDSLAARIDALGARLDSRIDSLAAQLQAHIEWHARQGTNPR
ncbi:MAG TPA: hypothetical protein VEV82_10970 [Actinomycetota bacterium]|nr:hypothetical protein [Actinomycetota bacterium]